MFPIKVSVKVQPMTIVEQVSILTTRLDKRRHQPRHGSEERRQRKPKHEDRLSDEGRTEGETRVEET